MHDIERPTPNSARAVRSFRIPPERLLAAFRRAVEGLPNWEVASSEERELRAVRTTRLLRFRDDVKVRVYGDGDDAGAELTSASRIGKGDLGQNPRNIMELLRTVEDDTPVAEDQS